MAVISPREEQIFQEMTRSLASDECPATTAPGKRVDSAAWRRAALLTIWVVSLIGAFGMAAGRVPMVACALSLACATFAIWTDFIAAPSAWPARPGHSAR